MTDEEYLKVVQDPLFRIMDFSISDIVRMKAFLDTWMLKIDDLKDCEVRKNAKQINFIKEAMMMRRY